MRREGERGSVRREGERENEMHGANYRTERMRQEKWGGENERERVRE